MLEDPYYLLVIIVLLCYYVLLIIYHEYMFNTLIDVLLVYANP